MNARFTVFVLGGFTCSYRLGAREHAMMLIWCRCSMLLPMQVVTIQLVDLYSKNVKMPTWKIHDSQSSTVFHFVFSVWLALVFDIPSSKIRFRVRAIERGIKQSLYIYWVKQHSIRFTVSYINRQWDNHEVNIHFM